MRLVELLQNQNIMIQLIWGEQKIEFPSEVLEKENDYVFVTSYIHNGSELQLNIIEGSNVVCNVFADNSNTGQRVSWKNVELTTENRNGKVLYCIKTRGFNNMAHPDDRRNNERTVIQVSGTVTDVQTDETVSVTVRDISGVGVAFYAPESYSPKSQQMLVKFTDFIDEKQFDVKVECSVSRTSKEEGRTIVGCRLVGENRDYQLYRLIKHLKGKSLNKINVINSEGQATSTAVNTEAVSKTEEEPKAENEPKAGNDEN